MRLRSVLTASLAAALALPLAAHAGRTTTALPAGVGAAGAVAKGTGTDLRPVANISYKGGTDLEFVTIRGRDYAVTPSERVTGGTGMLRMIDITNPAKPVIVGALPCNVAQNDVQVRGTTVFMGVDSGARDDACFQQIGINPGVGVIAIDIANPTRPRAVGFVPIKYGAHNSTIHPSGKFLYVSDAELTPKTAGAPGSQLGRLNVIDVRDVRNMKEVFTLPLPTGLSSHDVSFNKKGTRGYSAALTQTLILDTTDAGKPSIKTTILDPAVNISHGADITPDEKHLLVSDEQAGAESNGVCNVGGVHIYDISIELAPVKVGYYAFNPVNSLTATTNNLNLTCTAHVLDYGPTGKTFSNAGYAAGVRIVDASALVGMPKELASFTPLDADTWSAKQYKNKRFLFANDLARGFDVYEHVPGLGAVDTRTAMQQRYDVRRLGTTTFMNGAWCAEPDGAAAAVKASHTH